MKKRSAIRKRAERAKEGSSPRSPDLSAMPRRQLIALVSELQAKIEQAADVTGPLPVANASISDEALAQSALQVGVPSLIVDHSVRSGQIIDYPQGDVTVVGSVSSGAEIVAGGSIHVYGTLRGRAIAGSMGDNRARIYCRKLEAELLAIDGLYQTAEDMDSQFRGRAVQVRLKGDAITMESLG